MSEFRKYQFRSNNKARGAFRLLQRICKCARLGNCVVLFISDYSVVNNITNATFKYSGSYLDDDCISDFDKNAVNLDEKD
jgi:hypothetical protein